MTEIAQRVHDTPVSATVQLADLVSEMQREGHDMVDLSAGRAAESTPAYVCEAAAEALLRGDTHQTLARGTLAYRQACAAKLQRENGLVADPDREIIATMGVKQGLLLAMLATVNPGDEVVIEDPCFVSYEPIIRVAGGVPVRARLPQERGFRWSRADLEQVLTPRTRVILLNSPHNPTGVVHSLEDLDVIAAVAAERDLAVITDEVYERLTWGGRSHVSIASRPGMRDRTVTVMGLTKTFAMGGWRIGFVMAPPRLTAAMVVLQQHLITCPNAFVQAGATRALGEAPREVVTELWRDWEARSRWMASALSEIPGVQCAMPEGAFYAWVDVRRLGRSSADISDLLLREAMVAVVPGGAFGPGGEGYLRLTCARSWTELRDAVARMRRVLTD